MIPMNSTNLLLSWFSFVAKVFANGYPFLNKNYTNYLTLNTSLNVEAWDLNKNYRGRFIIMHINYKEE